MNVSEVEKHLKGLLALLLKKYEGMRTFIKANEEKLFTRLEEFSESFQKVLKRWQETREVNSANNNYTSWNNYFYMIQKSCADAFTFYGLLLSSEQESLNQARSSTYNEESHHFKIKIEGIVKFIESALVDDSLYASIYDNVKVSKDDFASMVNSPDLSRFGFYALRQIKQEIDNGTAPPGLEHSMDAIMYKFEERKNQILMRGQNLGAPKNMRQTEGAHLLCNNLIPGTAAMSVKSMINYLSMRLPSFKIDKTSESALTTYGELEKRLNAANIGVYLFNYSIFPHPAIEQDVSYIIDESKAERDNINVLPTKCLTKAIMYRFASTRALRRDKGSAGIEPLNTNDMPKIIVPPSDKRFAKFVIIDTINGADFRLMVEKYGDVAYNHLKVQQLIFAASLYRPHYYNSIVNDALANYPIMKSIKMKLGLLSEEIKSRAERENSRVDKTIELIMERLTNKLETLIEEGVAEADIAQDAPHFDEDEINDGDETEKAGKSSFSRAEITKEKSAERILFALVQYLPDAIVQSAFELFGDNNDPERLFSLIYAARPIIMLYRRELMSKYEEWPVLINVADDMRTILKRVDRAVNEDRNIWEDLKSGLKSYI